MDAELQEHIRHEVANALVNTQNNMMSEIRALITTEMGKVTTKQKEIADSQLTKLESTIGICGQKGHWKRECPEEIKSQNKISISDSSIKIDSLSFCNDPSSSPNILQPGESIVTSVGRLKDHIGVWKSNGASEYILRIIDDGYKLHLKQFQRRYY